LEAWEVFVDVGIIKGKVCSLKEYFQKNLLNDNFFYKNAISTFMERISSVDELTRWKQDFPSKTSLRKIQVG
jgi:hypothetical protein